MAERAASSRARSGIEEHDWGELCHESSHFAAAAAIVVLGAGCRRPPRPAPIPSSIAAAVANPNRPRKDTDRDAARKPVEVLAFAGVKPGEQVLELIPGGGYFTRVLSGAVGPKRSRHRGGAASSAAPTSRKASNGVAADPQFRQCQRDADVRLSRSAKTPGQYDLVWTSQNYHDLHLTQLKLDVVGARQG